MDPEYLKREKEKEREELRKEILEELKSKYYLKAKSEKLEVTDILDKYKEQFLAMVHDHKYSQWESIKSGIRTRLCLHFGVKQVKDIPKDKFDEFRKEAERFIQEYLLK